MFMGHNGTAIKGVCVGRRERRAGSWYFSRGIVTAQGGHGAVFGVIAQIAGLIRVSRYNTAK
jgi:hypothetical protein